MNKLSATMTIKRGTELLFKGSISGQGSLNVLFEIERRINADGELRAHVQVIELGTNKATVRYESVLQFLNGSMMTKCNAEEIYIGDLMIKHPTLVIDEQIKQWVDDISVVGIPMPFDKYQAKMAVIRGSMSHES